MNENLRIGVFLSLYTFTCKSHSQIMSKTFKEIG
jgi:hypothetical protein